jgi:glycosyltransferase involved in cell wall biosynthesis
MEKRKRMPNQPNKRLAILQILLSITETSGAYNQHCLAVSGERDITICTYFRSHIIPPQGIELFNGDDTLAGFFRALKAALAAKEYDVIHAHSPHVGFLFVFADLSLAGRFKPITVYNVQNSYQNYKLRNKLLMIPVFAYFQSVICCSDACFESFPDFYKRLGGDRLCVVPNGLDIDRVDYIMKDYPRELHTDTFTVASVGRLIDIKNPLSIVHAFRDGDDHASRLVFIGEGHLRDAITAEVKAHRLEARVELTGLVPRDQVFERLSKADVVVSASRGEGLPVAIIEAMACGCPVILSDIEPHREIAAGADFIPLIQPDDVAGFAREIRRFRQMPATERAYIGERCRKIAEERFSLSTMHRRYEAIYAQVLGGYPPGRVLYDAD